MFVENNQPVEANPSGQVRKGIATPLSAAVKKIESVRRSAWEDAARTTNQIQCFKSQVTVIQKNWFQKLLCWISRYSADKTTKDYSAIIPLIQGFESSWGMLTIDLPAETTSKAFTENGPTLGREIEDFKNLLKGLIPFNKEKKERLKTALQTSVSIIVKIQLSFNEIYSLRVGELENEVSHLHTKEDLKQARDQMNGEVERLQGEVSKLKTDAENYKAKIKILEETVKQQTDEIARLKAENQSEKEQKAKLQQELTQKEEQIVVLKTKYENEVARNKKFEEDINKLKAQVKQLKSERKGHIEMLAKLDQEIQSGDKASKDSIAKADAQIAALHLKYAPFLNYVNNLPKMP